MLRLLGRYQKIDGNNDVTLRAGFSPSIYSTPGSAGCLTAGGPCAITPFDDTKLATAWGTLRYHFRKRWSASGGVGFEDYEIADSQTGNTVNYMPASFFLQANNRDYRGWVVSLGFTYSN